MDATCKDGLERGDDEDKVIKHPKQRIMSCHEDRGRQEISSRHQVEKARTKRHAEIALSKHRRGAPEILGVHEGINRVKPSPRQATRRAPKLSGEH